MARNIKLTIEYLGTNYYGWQVLPGKPTVQGVLKEKLEALLRHEVKLIGASRTDAGVHALGQVANFYTENPFPVEKLKRALNALLPPDIKVTNAEETLEEFDSRRWAKGKLYRYRLFIRDVPSPFEYKRAWFLWHELNVEAMKEAAGYLIGTYDFSSFSKSDRKREVNPIRTIDRIELLKSENVLELLFYGRSFLRHMVRVMVATLVEVGKERLKPEEVKKIREEKDRKAAPFLAPPEGLYLEKVYYDDYPY